MKVRRAEREDLVAITRLAHGAYLAAYGDLVDQLAPARPIAVDPPPALKRKLLAGSLLVCSGEDTVLGFADYEVRDDHVTILDLGYCHEARDVAAALMLELQTLHPQLPISHDVVLGNLEHEHLYEEIGFVPGETVDADLGGHTVVARRWWFPPSTRVSQAATG